MVLDLVTVIGAVITWCRLLQQLLNPVLDAVAEISANAAVIINRPAAFANLTVVDAACLLLQLK